MSSDYFPAVRALTFGIALSLGAVSASAESSHAIAMYGKPALDPGFSALPYVNQDAPKGGRLVVGNTGGFDTLNPFAQKGTPPWQLRSWAYESLMGRSWDEPFTLYGLLAESVVVPDDRSWVEFTLRPEARFSDGSPVTVEDVIWSYQTLGTEGHLRYRGFWSKVNTIEQTGPRSLRLSFNVADRELALIAGLRPILKKAQWQGKDFAASGLSEAPIGTGAYVVSDFEAGRHVTLTRNPDYWGRDLPLRRGTRNFDELRIDFFGDETVLFEAFKAGELSAYREFNPDKWANAYDFPAVTRGDITKTEIPHQRPSGMTGLAMNTRRAPLDDWRVREALLLAFNFEYINGTVTGGVQPRITSYFSNSDLGLGPGPATGQVRDLLAPFADQLLPGTLEGYELPQSDGTSRNRKNLRRAVKLLAEAGWEVREGVLKNQDGEPLVLSVLLRQGDAEMKTVVEIYARALERLGITLSPELVDNAQYVARQSEFDFDLTRLRRDLSLSPGNEQRLYWGRAGVDQPGSRNLMGIDSPAVDAMIDHMLSAETTEAFTAAVRALDRILTAGRYVIPIWQYDKGRIAHLSELHHPETLPIYGDRTEFFPDVWWYQPNK
ncbi:extracellular solute-binding protein [Phaeobacter sp. QD34_3]|uniref:extracellular solute-binding protein n=1 Tax=unclassified Phaeobacter TaxID=2621772 RepID=UPI00237F77B5|nr:MULTISPECIES: extracellular solute-binding protein [unclassified Phaeobacter]MDE4131750.1 extracellular solute-binding protein [Phaeobacter sp. QD34_3]MDE4135161.1 extracellular solute-binding protein [Phaeobacter sp. QD34_24]